MKIINKNVETYIVEKKSKFIANIFYVENVKEAEKILKDIKKKYYDAKHNCFSYRILENENILEKASDDGEPSGTAGMPILDIIKGNDLYNILVVVTRYFGGILLGTGGLVKAYSDVTKNAINLSNLVEMEEGYEVEIELDYKNFNLFNHYCKKNNINIVEKLYNENIKVTVEVNEEKKDEICRNIENNIFYILKSRIMSKKMIRKNC